MFKKFFLCSVLSIYSLVNLQPVEGKPKKVSSKKLTKAKRQTISKYILMDYDSGIILEERGAEERIAPSSMTKLLTLYILFSQLKSGLITLHTEFLVSHEAKKTGGSKSFLEEGNSVDIDTLIRCIIVHSGNDASVVVAEGISGSVEKFVELMNLTAQKIGMVGSHFCNPTGLPDELHYSTVKDIALISRRLIADFPEFYHYFSEKEFEVNGIRQANRNRLLWKNFGVDGLKTGHTNAGGYGLASSAKNKNSRLISVINGCSSMKQREQESENLIRRGFNMISTYNLVKKYRPIKYVDVWLGQHTTVPIVSKVDINASVLREHLQDFKVYLNYKSPIAAPIRAGDYVGDLIVKNNDKEIRYPLIAGRNVAKLNEFSRAIAAIKFIIFGGDDSYKNKLSSSSSMQISVPGKEKSVIE